MIRIDELSIPSPITLERHQVERPPRGRDDSARGSGDIPAHAHPPALRAARSCGSSARRDPPRTRATGRRHHAAPFRLAYPARRAPGDGRHPAPQPRHAFRRLAAGHQRRYGVNGVMRIDPVTAQVVWRAPLPAAWLGLARAGAGWRDTVWASGGATNRVYRFVWQGGTAWATDSAMLADSGAKLFVAGIAPLPARGAVAVVGNLSDSVYLLDAATLQRRAAVAVGHRPYTAVADSARLYVSNWGDSSVSVVDLSDSPTVRRSFFVGPHPSALALRESTLFVALAGANGVARVDLSTGGVVEQLTVALAPGAPVGSDPNALALSPDGRTLYVAMAGNNAVAAVHLSPATMQVAGLIPVGWYPTAVAVSTDGTTLFVANGKGAGSHANPDGSYIANLI